MSVRWLTEYVRRPMNVVLLIVVPLVFVGLSAGVLTEFADLLSDARDLGNVEAATAGWAAAVLAGVASFFHVSDSRGSDRRLAAAGAGAGRVVASRLVSTLALAGIAAAGALAALRFRSEAAATPRVIGATVVFALIYAGLGVIVGALVRSDLNGSLIVVFIWFFDVFLGPAMGGSAFVIRLFPLYFPTMVVTGVDSTHAGALGDVGASLIWATASLAVAAVVLTMTTRSRRAGGSIQRWHSRRRAGLVAAGRELRRMPAMWILIVALPVAFISASIAITPEDPAWVQLVEGGRTSLRVLAMPDVHGAVMVPITVGFLASLAGLFVISDSAQADRRLSLAGFRPAEILTVRMTVIAGAALLATAVSLGVTAVSFRPQNWPVFVAGNVLVALTYATIGVVVGRLFGRLGGVYVLLVLPFLDVGVAQNAMFDAAPPAWGRLMPAHGAVRVVMDGAFTSTFDEYGALLIALIWLVAVSAAAWLVFRQVAGAN
jgi:hypothetical protein